MADYISRETALELIDNAPIIAGNENETLISAPKLSDKVYCLPAADVRPVVRGKWEVGGMFDDIGRCSCCHYMFPSDTAMTEFRFCPNCGADMRPYKDGRRGEKNSG